MASVKEQVCAIILRLLRDREDVYASDTPEFPVDAKLEDDLNVDVGIMLLITLELERHFDLNLVDELNLGMTVREVIRRVEEARKAAGS